MIYNGNLDHTKWISKIVTVVLLLVGARIGFSQGSFINLNFEQANVSAYGAGSTSIPATSAIPGWTAYINGNPEGDIWYNGQSLGAPVVVLEGTNNPAGFLPIQGNFFVAVQGGYGYYGTAGLGQTGKIPPNAQSLIFWGGIDGMVITFDGQPLSFVSIGSTGNYSIMAADISAFAGQTGELLFTALDGLQIGPSGPGLYPGGGGLIDNIQFSPSPVPEPDEFALVGLGSFLFALRHRKSATP